MRKILIFFISLACIVESTIKTGISNISNNSSYDVAPSWSPDDKKIVFTSSKDGNWEVYSIEINLFKKSFPKTTLSKQNNQ